MFEDGISIFESTIMRYFEENREEVFGNADSITITLHEEPGELLITMFMTEEEVKEAVVAAAKTILPSKVISEVQCDGYHIVIKFIK